MVKLEEKKVPLRSTITHITNVQPIKVQQLAHHNVNKVNNNLFLRNSLPTQN